MSLFRRVLNLDQPASPDLPVRRMPRSRTAVSLGRDEQRAR